MESGAAETFSVTAGVVAGILFLGLTDSLRSIPGLIVAIPAFLSMRGAVYGSLGARLSTKLHLGDVQPRYSFKGVVFEEALASFVLGVSQAVFIGALAYPFSLLLGARPDLSALLAVFTVAGVLSALIMTFITVYSDVFLYRRGLDPDNVIGPYITAIGDSISILCIILSIRLLGV